LGGAEDDVKDNERACGAPMFDNLQDRLGEVFDRLKRRGALSESDVAAALREVRVALLEADVALPVVKDFVEAVREKALGQEVLRSVTPGQMVVKIVHDHLVETLSCTTTWSRLSAARRCRSRST
jgi:signal recognition particle subunit SRP54